MFLMELDLLSDERGFFARSFSEDELGRAGLHTHFPQGNVSWNAAKHTLRGMHYQAAPNAEVKIVGCTAGAIFDVVVDLRAGSPTRFDWLAVELTPATGNQLYIPAGFAHGFLTRPTRPRSATAWAPPTFLTAPWFRPTTRCRHRWPPCPA